MENEVLKAFVWKELMNSKFQEAYLTFYLDRQRFWKRTVKIVTIALSFSGILGWKWFETYAWIVILISCILQLLSQTEDLFFRSSDEIHNIKNIVISYRKYLRKMERFWLDIQQDNLENSDEKLKKYQKIKQRIINAESEISIKDNYYSMKQKADYEARLYADRLNTK